MGICFPKEKAHEEQAIIVGQAPEIVPRTAAEGGEPEAVGSEELKEGGAAEAAQEEGGSALPEGDIPAEKDVVRTVVAATTSKMPTSKMEPSEEAQRRREELDQLKLDLQRRLDGVHIPPDRKIVKQSSIINKYTYNWNHWAEQVRYKRKLEDDIPKRFKKWMLTPDYATYYEQVVDKVIKPDTSNPILVTGGWYTGSIFTYSGMNLPHGPGTLLTHDCSMQYEGIFNEGKMVGEGRVIMFAQYPILAESPEREPGVAPQYISRRISSVHKTLEGNIAGLLPDSAQLAKEVMPELEDYEKEQVEIFNEINNLSRRGSGAELLEKIGEGLKERVAQAMPAHEEAGTGAAAK